MRTRTDIDFENTKLVSYLWCDETIEPIGTIEIFHGMAEHILRYNDFAEELVKNGYVVIGHDHYAHGNSTTIEQIGVIENGDFIEKVIEASKTVRNYYAKYFVDGTSYLFSHSMGSMVAQRYIQLYPKDFNKVVLCGTDINSVKYQLARILTKNIIKKHGPISYTKIVDQLTMKQFNKRFKKDHPDVGWLSENENNVKNYINDPLCGAPFPTNYYYSISSALVAAGKKENLDLINKNIKILLISGKDDPVTNFSKSTMKMLKRYKKLGIDSYAIIYYNARHELLNEKDETRNEVINDVIKFYQS